MVLVDGLPIAVVAAATDKSKASVTQVVQLVFAEVEGQFRTENPKRAPRPGFVILTVEVPELASVGLAAGVAAAGGIVLEERRNGS